MIKDYEQWRKLYSYEYRQGYTKALQDVLSYFNDEHGAYGIKFSNDLKTHKMKFNRKTIAAFLKCMIENRIALQENPDAFIRCKDGGFELCIGNRYHKLTNDPDWVNEQLEYYEKRKGEIEQ